MLFFEKNIFWGGGGGNLVILAQKWYVFITVGLFSGFFFFILHNKRVQEVHENFVSRFLRKNLFWSNLIFLGHFLLFDWFCSELSQAFVTTESLNIQDMISLMITTGSLNRTCAKY